MEFEILNHIEMNPDGEIDESLVFDELKKDQSAVYRILCPHIKSFDIDEFESIKKDVPSSVYEIILATTSRFYKFEIWKAEVSEIKDPILLGREKKINNDGSHYGWEDRRYLLARWGEELRPFEELRLAAKEMLIKQVKKELITTKGIIMSAIEDIDLFVDLAIENDAVIVPRFNPGLLK